VQRSLPRGTAPRGGTGLPSTHEPPGRTAGGVGLSRAPGRVDGPAPVRPDVLEVGLAAASANNHSIVASPTESGTMEGPPTWPPFDLRAPSRWGAVASRTTQLRRGEEPSLEKRSRGTSVPAVALVRRQGELAPDPSRTLTAAWRASSRLPMPGRELLWIAALPALRPTCDGSVHRPPSRRLVSPSSPQHRLVPPRGLPSPSCAAAICSAFDLEFRVDTESFARDGDAVCVGAVNPSPE
jgi:hypothetical protein